MMLLCNQKVLVYIYLLNYSTIANTKEYVFVISNRIYIIIEREDYIKEYVASKRASFPIFAQIGITVVQSQQKKHGLFCILCRERARRCKVILNGMGEFTHQQSESSSFASLYNTMHLQM